MQVDMSLKYSPNCFATDILISNVYIVYDINGAVTIDTLSNFKEIYNIYVVPETNAISFEDGSKYLKLNGGSDTLCLQIA